MYMNTCVKHVSLSMSYSSTLFVHLKLLAELVQHGIINVSILYITITCDTWSHKPHPLTWDCSTADTVYPLESSLAPDEWLTGIRMSIAPNHTHLLIVLYHTYCTISLQASHSMAPSTQWEIVAIVHSVRTKRMPWLSLQVWREYQDMLPDVPNQYSLEILTQQVD